MIDEAVDALHALALNNNEDIHDEENDKQDEIRRSVLNGDLVEFKNVLHSQHIDQPALVFLMDWFHSWQQEYEAFIQVIEAEAAQAGEPVKMEADLEELEVEAQDIFRGFEQLTMALVATVEAPDELLDKYGWSLLMQAANSGLRDLLDILIANGSNVNACGSKKDGPNALYLAISSEHVHEALALLKNGAMSSATKIVTNHDVGADIDDDDPSAEDCAWFQACRLGQLEVVAEMLALGVDVNFPLPTTGDRAIHVAALFEMRDVIELLLVNETLKLNAKNHNGQTCLFGCSNVELVQLLVTKGVDPRVRDTDGETAYSIARALGDDLVAKYLNTLDV